uniref:CSON011999 protein n=1 Tax=Culicoides sonorensis TaxID=179676 RepID=A0A336MGF1_CULSO
MMMNSINTNFKINNNNNNNITNDKTMDTNRNITRKPRTKLKAINNFLMCCLCKGYIVEATAITECLHSFCRSCIVKHLTEQTYCPKCKIQNVSKANLRPDDIIKALVYKTIPGLYQSEVQKTKKFNKAHNIESHHGDDSSTTVDDDKKQNDDKSVENKQHYFSPDEPISLSLTYHAESLVGSGVTVQAPPINYLQCPAAVTVHHLKRFVSAKYGIDIERDVNIEIICEDEVLPEDFTLMDVAYCYNWTRTSPLQLMYRIFLHANSTEDQQENNIALPVQNQKSSHNNHNNNNNSQKQNENKNQTDFSANNRFTNNMSNSNNNNRNGNNNNGRSYSNNTDSNKNSGNDSQFLVPSTDFKRLRSNAGGVSSSQSTSPGKDTNAKKNTSNDKSGTVTHESVKQSEYKTQLTVQQQKLTKSNSNTGKEEENDEKRQKTTNELSNAKPKEMNEKINLSVKQNLSTIEKEDLKLRYEAENNKKCYTNTKKSSSNKTVEQQNQEKSKPEIPKLKIELPKNNIKGSDGSKPKIILKLPSPIEKRYVPSQPNPNVDVTEYAKNIGLCPVSELQERMKRDSEREESSHKKRKKAKHSKEPSGKKRKIHAEVSSLTLDDEVKLKVKMIKPPSKHEKRSNSVDETKSVKQDTNDGASKQPKTPNNTSVSKETPTPNTENEKSPATSSILRTIRHKPMVYIPNVDKNIPEEQDTISDIVKRVQQVPVNKAPSPNKPQTPPKANSPIKISPKVSPVQKSPSPVVTQKQQLNQQKLQQQQKQQQQQQQQQQNNQKLQLQKQQQQQQQKMQNSKSIAQQMQAMQALQALKAQMSAGNMMMMPPFGPGSLVDIRMQRMSSPSHTSRSFSPKPNNSTSPLSLPMPAPISNQQMNKNFPGLPTNLPQQQQQRQNMKRPAGSDTPMPKTPRVNHMDLSEHKMRKQVYAPIMDFQSLNKKSPEPRPILSKPPPVSQPKNTDQNQKKPCPRLVAPSSISVTRVGDNTSNVPVQQTNRPAVEILKIPSTVPAIDQKSNMNKQQTKATRPPPGTIPLFKIQKSLQTGKANANQANNKPRNEGDKALDLSLSPTGGSGPKKYDVGPVIDLTDSGESNSNKKSNEKPPQNNVTQANQRNLNTNNTGKTESVKPKMPGLTALPLPKLQEISKNRALVRQQNLSVRNVPNPSALAFRHQAQIPGLTKVNSPPASKLNEKVQQLHNMKEIQQRQRIAPED